MQLGWRGDPLTALKIQPHAFVCGELAPATRTMRRSGCRGSSATVLHPAGRRHRRSHRLGKNYQIDGNDEIEFGSRVLFEPELAVGTQLNDRMTIEASWVHMSHAQLFSGQNPGIDNLGVRLNLQALI